MMESKVIVCVVGWGRGLRGAPRRRWPERVDRDARPEFSLRAAWALPTPGVAGVSANTTTCIHSNKSKESVDNRRKGFPMRRNIWCRQLKGLWACNQPFNFFSWSYIYYIIYIIYVNWHICVYISSRQFRWLATSSGWHTLGCISDYVFHYNSSI